MNTGWSSRYDRRDRVEVEARHCFRLVNAPGCEYLALVHKPYGGGRDRTFRVLVIDVHTYDGVLDHVHATGPEIDEQGRETGEYIGEMYDPCQLRRWQDTTTIDAWLAEHGMPTLATNRKDQAS